jgi:hypothetical protein
MATPKRKDQRNLEPLDRSLYMLPVSNGLHTNHKQMQKHKHIRKIAIPKEARHTKYLK